MGKPGRWFREVFREQLCLRIIQRPAIGIASKPFYRATRPIHFLSSIPMVLVFFCGCVGPKTVYRTNLSTPPPVAPQQTDKRLSIIQSTPPLVRGKIPGISIKRNHGPFVVSRYGVSDGLRDGPKFGTATVYYPEDAQAPYASLVIVPGFVHPESAMKAWGPFLASHGIVTLTIGANKLNDDPLKRRDALLDAVHSLKAEHRREDSPLWHKLALDRIGVAGWSMGGGGAQLAAVADPSLRVVIGFCPWLPKANFEHPVPSLIMAGTLDSIANVFHNARAHYAGISETTPKMIIEIPRGGHWIANDPANANSAIGQIGLSWLKVYLEGDTRYRQFLLTPPISGGYFRHNLE